MSTTFLTSLANEKLSNKERAIALIWHVGLEDHTSDISINDIVSIFESSGYSKQNKTRLNEAIAKDKRITKAKKNHYRINIKYRDMLDDLFLPFANHKRVKISSSVVPYEMYEDTRAYIEKVVLQLNSSYDSGLYDCCAVMCRRLLETLIIEVYEKRNQTEKLKNQDGDFHMFSGLKSIIENDQDISLSRNTKKGLNDFKKLGDLSAHSRRFNARKNDIDKIIDDIRVASEELLHLSNLVKS